MMDYDSFHYFKLIVEEFMYVGHIFVEIWYVDGDKHQQKLI